MATTPVLPSAAVIMDEPDMVHISALLRVEEHASMEELRIRRQAEKWLEGLSAPLIQVQMEKSIRWYALSAKQVSHNERVNAVVHFV